MRSGDQHSAMGMALMGVRAQDTGKPSPLQLRAESRSHDGRTENGGLAGRPNRIGCATAAEIHGQDPSIDQTSQRANDLGVGCVVHKGATDQGDFAVDHRARGVFRAPRGRCGPNSHKEAATGPSTIQSRGAAFGRVSDSGSTRRWLIAKSASSRRLDTPSLLKIFVR